MEHGPSRRVALSRALLTLLFVLTATACGGEPQPKQAAPLPAPSASVEPEDEGVEVTGLPEGVDSDVTDTAVGAENGANLDFVSPVYTVEPGGSLPQPVKVLVELTNAVPQTVRVVVVTRPTEGQPWTYQRGALTSDLKHVEFTTKSLGQIGVLSLNLDASLAAFQADLRRGVAAGVNRKVSKPECDAKEAAREDGYSVVSSKSRTLHWCFGLEDEKRVLRITNRKLSPIQVAHPGVPVLDNPANAGAFTSWVGVLGGTTTFLAPGRTATYDADLEPLAQLMLSADAGAATQSLRLLQATVRALALRLTGFDAGTVNVSATVAKLLAMPQCRKSIGKGSDAMLAGCFAPGKLVRTFGQRAVLLAPHLADPTTPALLRQLAQAMAAAQLGEQQRILVKRAAPDFTRFTGIWTGKARLLSINADGTVTEALNSATTGELVITLTYQLSDPDTNPASAVASATITSVTLGNRKLLRGRVPRVGDKGSLTVRNGVVRPPYLRTNYCDPPRARRGVCGK